LTPIVTADATNYATLTIGGASPDGNVYENICALASVPLDGCLLRTPRRPWRRGANHPGEAPRWYRLRTKRHEKAAAKRTKMRADRYAARWEQAHLRDRPAPVDRAERIRKAVDELEALVDAWESSK
jgi:hypothetical protein